MLKIKPGFKLTHFNDSYFIVKNAEVQTTNSGVIHLNEISLFLWKQLSVGPKNELELTRALRKEYIISMPLAKVDVRLFLDTLRRANILEEI